MSTLNFKSNKTLKSLARKTLFSKEFKIAYRDQTTIEKSFWLVKDDGIYVMNCYVKKWFNFNGKREKVNQVIYASGFNPKTNDDVWEDSRDAVGGDDFAENIPLDYSQLNRLRNGGNLTIKVTEESLEIIA
tara:strand:+ start:423 stop:815 length:393 start_codon:yes stop_codon:yes gene_type:complete